MSDTLNKKILEQYNIFYKLLKKQYPNEQWNNLTEAEKQMMIWFDEIVDDSKDSDINKLMN